MERPSSTNVSAAAPQDALEGQAQNQPTEKPPAEVKTRRARLKPNLPLPSGKLSIENQLKMLRAYASQSKSGTKAVSFKIVAQLIGLDETGVSSAKEFFEDIGALQRASLGEHTPVSDLLSWASKVDFNVDEANEYLHKLFGQTWFAETISGAYVINKSLKRETLAGILANTAGGEKIETEPRARALVDLLAATGYLRKNDSGELILALSQPEQVTRRVEGMTTATPNLKPEIPLDTTARTVQVGTLGGGVPITITLTITDWPVVDVIRLLKFLRSGEDQAEDANTP